MLLLLLLLLIPCNASHLVASSCSNSSLVPTTTTDQSTQTDDLTHQHATMAAQVLHKFAQLHLQQKAKPTSIKPISHDSMITDGIYGAGL